MRNWIDILGMVVLGIGLGTTMFVAGLSARHPLGVFFAIAAGLFMAELWHRATGTP